MSCETGRSGPAQSPFACPDGYPWWDPGPGFCCWAAFQPKGAANLAASYIDLSGNGNNATVGLAPTWDAVNGWTFDGATQYLKTSFVPQNDQSQSMIIRYSDFVPGVVNSMLAGEYNVQGFWLAENQATGLFYPSNGSSSLGSALPSSGTIAVAGTRGYLNGSPDVSGLTSLPAWSPVAVYIGCLNNNGVTARWANVKIQAMAIYDCTLSASQIAALTTEMAAL